MGNTLQESNDLQHAYGYNAQNRISKYRKDGQIKARYHYNALGQRIHKAVIEDDGSEQHTLFHYGQQGELLGETQLNDPNNINQQHTQNIVWLQMRPIVAIDTIEDETPRFAWLHSDHLFTARSATNAEQNVIWRWHSDAFGVGEAEIFVHKDQPALTLNLRFPGQYRDEESGLYYNYFRSYDPSKGRYTQADPIGLAGGINAFSYGNGSPLTVMDLLGLCGVDIQEGNLRETALQRERRLAGDVEGYYKARAAAGDHYATRALMVVNNECISWDTCVMAFANFRLGNSAIYHGVDINPKEVQILLMNAHANYVANDNQGVPGLLNPEQIAQYHHEVFTDLGLSNATFGGTLFFGMVWEANVWRKIPYLDWCEGCDTE